MAPHKIAVRTRQILGFWKVASFAIFAGTGDDIKVIYPWQQGPFFFRGVLVYSADGTMEYEMSRLARNAAGQAEEVKAQFTGRFEVTGRGSHVVHRIHACTNDERWVGQEEVRQVYFRGNILTLAAPLRMATGEPALAVTSHRRMLPREMKARLAR